MKANQETISQLLQHGRLGDAITCLLAIFKEYDDSELTSITILSASYHSLRRKKLTFSNSEIERQTNKIVFSCQELTRKLNPAWELEIPEIKGMSNKFTTSTATVPSSKSPLEKKILFLAANPKDTDRLRLGEEAKKIEKALRRSNYREQFKLITKWAVDIYDLRQSLLDERPSIVHFSGHGSSTGKIYFEGPEGKAQDVSPKALGNLFKLFKEDIDCVVLNACYAETQAKEISNHIKFVVGMNDKIPDTASVEFSYAFYDALGAGRPFSFAYDLGCNTLELFDLRSEDIPVLHKRNQ